MTDADWKEDAIAARKYSETHPRAMKYPPHWLRCEFMRNGKRCCKGSGHTETHEEPKL